MILDSDLRLQASLPKANMPACGCAWRTFRDRRGSEKLEIHSVCLLHRRWLRAIMAQMQGAPTSFHASVKLVGPAYQSATRHSAGGHVPEGTHLEAHPQQVGGVAQMDGPLFQQARSALVEKAPEPEISEPEPTLEDILGFDPSKIQEGT